MVADMAQESASIPSSLVSTDSATSESSPYLVTKKEVFPSH